MAWRETGRELKALVWLAGPLALASAGIQMMSLVDTAVVGRLSDVALGAVALANGLYFTPSVLGMGLMMGLDPLIAQALGAGHTSRAKALVIQAVWLALLTSVVLTPPLFLLPPLLVRWGVPPEVAEQATRYFHIRALTLLPFLLFIGLKSYLQAVGRIWPLILAVITGNLINLWTNVIFVFGREGLQRFEIPSLLRPLLLWDVPGFGVQGSAMATLCCSWAMAIWLCAALAVRGDRIFGRPDWLTLRESTRVGLPIGLQMAAEVGVFALAGVLVARMGATALAAHQIALQLASFTFMGAYGVSGAASVRVGLHVGAQDLPGVRRAGVLAIALCAAWMGTCAVSLWMAPDTFAARLTNQASVLALSLPLLQIVAAFQLSDGFQSVGAGLLRGAGDTRFPFFVNLAGHYLFGLPLALYLGFSKHLEVVGVWWGLALGLTCVAAAILVRFFWLARRPIRPLEPAGAPR